MPMAHNGLAKLIEECGELQQVAGKLLAYPNEPHPDGKGDLRERLEDEIADVMAACRFVTEALGLDLDLVDRRADEKENRFRAWHAEEVPGPAGAWWTIRPGHETAPLDCDCHDGCWGDHSTDWWTLLFTTEEQAQEAWRRCHQTKNVGEAREHRLQRGHYVIVEKELRFCSERDLHTLEVWLLTEEK